MRTLCLHSLCGMHVHSGIKQLVPFVSLSVCTHQNSPNVLFMAVSSFSDKKKSERALAVSYTLFLL